MGINASSPPQLRNVGATEINVIILLVLLAYGVAAFFPFLGLAAQRRISSEEMRKKNQNHISGGYISN